MTFIKLNRSPECLELLKYPPAFVLLTIIAFRAKRTEDFNIHNLKIGEALIGDFRNIGLSESTYRLAKQKLLEWKFITTKATNRGTVATILDTRICDINGITNNGQGNGQTTDKATGQQRQTITVEESKESINVQFEKLVEWINIKLNKKFKGDKTARGQFNARIKEGYTGKSFSKALDEIMKDKFHIESNFKWVTPEYLTREKQLEKWFNVDSEIKISEDRSKIMHPVGTRDKLFTQD